MPKRKTKRNPRTSQGLRGFKICQDPMMQLAEDGLLSSGSASDCRGSTRVHGQPLLFAIARDPGTIFASWNINWRSVFKEAMPADRHIHLQVTGGNGAIETRVTIEPMCATHFIAVSGLHNSYRVELGYFQPVDVWHSVAMSAAVKMPQLKSGEVAGIDLATIPFHLSFQQLANLLGAAGDASIGTVISQFQTRQLNSDKTAPSSRLDIQILGHLNQSLPELAAAQRDFKKIDAEKLARRARRIFRAAASSPVAGFQASAGS